MSPGGLIERLGDALRLGGADETSVAYLGRRAGATRFASNRLTQCVETEEPVVEVRVAVGSRLGAARTGVLDPEALDLAHRRAVEVARARPPIPGFAGFPDPEPVADVGGWVGATAGAGAEDRAAVLRPAFAEAERRGLGCAGVLLTSEAERAVVSSRGIRAHARQTFSRVEIIAAAGGASGHASAADADFARLDVAGVARRAFERATAARDPVDVAPGAHDVVLEPAAVRELLEWLGVTAFHARAIRDGTSVLAGRIGEPIFGENVTIFDDPLATSDGAAPRPFDSEGVPARRVDLVERGVARGFVSDTLAAARLGARSTGHAAPIGHELGDAPVAASLRLGPGDTPRADLAARLGRGLLVTRFHYVNGLLDTRRALMTGFTRDGLFVVEGGRVVGAAHNLRWTQSLVDAFRRIDAISRETETVPTWWSEGSAFVVPALLVRGWTFTSPAA